MLFGLDHKSPAGTEWMTAAVMSGMLPETGGENLARLRALGVSFNAAAGRETLTIDVRCPKTAWVEAGQLIVKQMTESAIQNPSLDELRLRQHVSLDSLRQESIGLAQAIFWTEQCGVAMRSAPVMGTDSSIETITIADLRDFTHRCLTSDNCVLGISGPITEAMAREFRDIVEDILPGGRRVDPAPACPRPSGLNVRIIQSPYAELSTILIGTVSAHLTSDTAGAVMAMAAALHGIPSASPLGLERALHAQRGLTEEVTVESGRLRLSGNAVELPADDPCGRDFFTICTKVDSYNALYVAHIIHKELSDLNTAGLSEPEMVTMGKLVPASSSDSAGTVARMRAEAARRWLGITPDMQADSIAGRLTPAAARRLLREALDPHDLWVVAIVPDANRFYSDILGGAISYRYQLWANTPETRKLDREYVGVRPFWQAEKIRSITADKLFRR